MVFRNNYSRLPRIVSETLVSHLLNDTDRSFEDTEKSLVKLYGDRISRIGKITIIQAKNEGDVVETELT